MREFTATCVQIAVTPNSRKLVPGLSLGSASRGLEISRLKEHTLPLQPSN